jgi:uncharacterized protein
MSDDKTSTSAPNTDPATPESSMQEIIASISRIIAKDNRPPRPIPAPPRENSGILELTDAIEADGTVRKLDGQSRTTQPVNEVARAAPGERNEPKPSEGNAGVRPKTEDPRDKLLSAAASEAAVAAFGQLGAEPGEQRAEPGSLGGAGRSLEEIVRETVRPLLRAWLKEHFPDIVERLVREEIQRLVTEAEPR